MYSEDYKVPDIYSGTYQDRVGGKGVSTFVNSLIATKRYTDKDFYIPEKKNGYIHSDDAIHGKDIMVRGVPIDVKWYTSISKKGVVWIEFEKYRKVSEEDDWEFCHNGIFRDTYQPKYLVWGDRNLNKFYFLPVKELKDYINSIPEQKRNIHEHESSDSNGYTLVHDYTITKEDLQKNHLITFVLDANTNKITKC